MPDILIRGMDMPKTCADCHDADLPTAISWLGAKCPLAHGIIDPGVYDLRHERHPDCPIHELPPHGDLIDLFKLLHPEGDPFNGPMAVTACTIIEQPTVIPANKEALT